MKISEVEESVKWFLLTLPPLNLHNIDIVSLYWGGGMNYITEEDVSIWELNNE